MSARLAGGALVVALLAAALLVALELGMGGLGYGALPSRDPCARHEPRHEHGQQIRQHVARGGRRLPARLRAVQREHGCQCAAAVSKSLRLEI